MVRTMIGIALAAGLWLAPTASSRGADAAAGASVPRLPEGCGPLSRQTSLDGRRVAFVGGYEPPAPGAAKRYGLFVVDLATREVRQLIDRGLKTTAAWSPDSRHLALGDAADYVASYPLAIVDADTGAIDRTGVEGGGPAWSPDGGLVAVSTGFHGGGSWSGGVPVDGHIGLYDLKARRLTPLTPPGYNLYDARTDQSAMRGAVRPTWSPDGRRLAFELWEQSRRGDEKAESREVWVVDRDGTNLRRALAGSTHDARWSPDGARLTIEGSKSWPGGTVEVAALPVLGPEAMPRPPASLVEALRRSEEAAARARAFDVAPILAANRAWQVPASDRLRNVQFVHAMAPHRLDERFAWRADGAMLSDVASYEGDRPELYRGQATVFAPGGTSYRFAPGSRYPRAEAMDAGKARAYALDHLMGTRMSLVALAWGRDPSAFDLRDARKSEDGATIALELAPRWSRNREEFRLNAGAMFERTSWAYVHDLRVGWAELTVDAATLRVVREVDHDLQGKVIGEVDLGEWIDAGEGRSVPGRVRVRFPGQAFSVDDRFVWHPPGLWILRSGESRFDGKEPERETIDGLAIDAPTPALDDALGRALEGASALDAPAPTPPEPRMIVAGRFALGKRIALAGGLLESLAFTFPDVLDEERMRFHWDHPDLRAVLTRPPGGEAQGSVLLVLYDGGGWPVGSASADFPADGASLTLDLGRSRTLGAARSWSLTTFAGDVPRPIAPAERPIELALSTFPARPGADQVVQVDAEAGRRGASAKGLTRIRALRLAGDGPASRDAEVELVGLDAWKDILARATLMLLDAKGTPIAAGSLDHRFRVEGDIYDAPKLAVPIRGTTPGDGDLRVAVGLHTTIVGAPMGSLWGMFLDASSPYPAEMMLAGDEPAAWRRGLVALDYEMGITRRALRRGDEPGPAAIDEAGWGAIHRAVRPHGDRLAALLPMARAVGPGELARVCLLAGYSGDDRLAGPLRPLLDDPERAIRDAAAVGLGLLGHEDMKARLEAIVTRPAEDSDLGVLTRAAARRALGVLDR